MAKKRAKKKIPQKRNKRIAILLEAAKAGNEMAMLDLGLSYMTGEDVKYNYERAIDWLQKAARAGNEKGMFHLGLAYMYGDEDHLPDYEQAKRYLTMAGNLGVEDVDYLLLKLEECEKKTDVNDFEHIYQRYLDDENKDIEELGEYFMNVDDEEHYEILLPLFIKEADAGDVKAQYYLGNYYLGEGESDPKRQEDLGIHYLRLAALSGDLKANHDLGVEYINGQHFDTKEGVELIRYAADHNRSFSAHTMAMILYEGVCVERDYHKAVDYLINSFDTQNDEIFETAQKWLEQGFIDQHDEFRLATALLPYRVDMNLYLIRAYLEGRGTAQDFDEAKSYLKARAKRDPDVKLCLDALEQKNPIDYLTAKAQDNDGEAMYLLGCCYYRGILCEKDETAAAQWFEQSAEQAFPPAMSFLGEMYLRGWMVEKNPRRGIKLLKKAGDLEDVNALFMLGQCYLEGVGVKRNEETGLNYLDRAYGVIDATKENESLELRQNMTGYKH